MVRKIKKFSLTYPHLKNKTSEKDEEVFNWLLKEYDARGKELLELEKLSFILLTFSATIVTFVFPKIGLSPIEMAFYSLPTILLLSTLFDTTISFYCARLQKKLVCIEHRLKEIKPHSIFNHYEKTNLPTVLYQFLTTGKTLLVLLFFTAVFTVYNFKDLSPLLDNAYIAFRERQSSLIGITLLLVLCISAIGWISKRKYNYSQIK